MNSRDSNKNSLEWKHLLFLFFLFIAAVLIPLYPVLFRFSSAYMGGGELDGWLWRFWWMKTLISSAWSAVPFDFSLVVYCILCAGNFPETGNVLDVLVMSVPLEALLGAPAYYNAKIIIILLLNCYSGYALGVYLFKNRYAATAAGVSLVLNPFIMNELTSGRVRHVILFTMPLYIIALWETHKTSSWKKALSAGFWLGLTTVIYFYYGMALLFFSLIFLLYHLAFNRKSFSAGFGSKVILIILVFLLLSVPFSYRYIELVFLGEKLPETTWGKAMPPPEFLLDRSPLPPENRDFVMSLRRIIRDSPDSLFIFRLNHIYYMPLIFTLLLLISLFFYKHKLSFWFVNFCFFYMLTIGPYLKIGSGAESVFLMGDKPVPLPYTFFFTYVPFVSRLFSPVRWMGFLMVIAAVIIAGSTAVILDLCVNKVKNLSPRILQGSAVVLIMSAAIAQLFLTQTAPVPLTLSKPPSFYESIAQDPMVLGVVELPYPPPESAIYYQVFHQKKVLGGWEAIPDNFPAGTKAANLAVIDTKKIPDLIDYFERLGMFMEEPGEAPLKELEKLEKMGYEYIIVHERGCIERFPQKGREYYYYLVKNLTSCLGEPQFYYEHWIKLNPEGGAAESVRGGMAVFRTPKFDD